MEQEEIWRDIDGYEGLYQVSNLGRVKSIGNGMILSPRMTNNGYLQVGLYNEGKRKWFMVHRLVGQAFIPNPEGLPQINHKNEIKTDNSVHNLEWCDGKYNSNYGTRNERATKNMVQTNIRNGRYDPEMCGLDEKERHRLYYQKNREKILEYHRKYRLKKKKNNHPSEESLW